MEYRAVKDRCAVIIDLLRLPITRSQALAILESKGFKMIEVNPVALARGCVGMSQYRRGARTSEAPSVVDCSGLIKWLYGRCGIWLPRRSIQQRELGERVDWSDLSAGDVVFISGWIDYYFDDPANGVGHVGIYSGQGTIIHAANKKVGVVETALEQFVDDGKFRGARRYIPKDAKVKTLVIPPERDIETSDDFRWIILQSL